MALDASRAEIATNRDALKQNARVQRSASYPRDQALQELKQSSGLADVIDSLPQNPLPDAFIVTAEDNTPQGLESLRDGDRAMAAGRARATRCRWARRLDATLRLRSRPRADPRRLLALALIAVTFNTIRLQVLTRREEIEVVKLIGATDSSSGGRFYIMARCRARPAGWWHG